MDATYVCESLVLIFVILFVFVGVTLAVVDTARAKEQLEELEVDEFNLLNNMQEADRGGKREDDNCLA